MKTKTKQFPEFLFIEKEIDDNETYYLAHESIEEAAELGRCKVIAVYKLIEARELIAKAEWQQK